MNPIDEMRFVGVVADGPTDQQIISKLVSSIIANSAQVQPLFLGQSLAPLMQTYRNEASKSGQYGLCNGPARRLRGGIINVLHGAISELRSHIPRDLTDCDLLVIATDSEWLLQTPDQYFVEERFLAISKVVLSAIEEYYHHPTNRYRRQHLPLVIPLVLFPSIDILVAAAKHDDTFDFHGKKARDIKRKLYGVDDLRYLGSEIDKQALNFITAEKINAIYKHLPELRIPLRILSWNHS